VSITLGRVPESAATIALSRFLACPCRNAISLSSVDVDTAASFATELQSWKAEAFRRLALRRADIYCIKLAKTQD
jgi:hypothetical protein